MKNLLSWLLILALASPRMWADSGPDPEHIESIKRKVAACVEQHRRVAVETYDGRRLQGTISESGINDFVLNNGTRATTLAYRDVKKIRWPSPVWKQVKVFAAAAAVAGALFGLVVLLGGTKG